MSKQLHPKAPEIIASDWLNCSTPMTLNKLGGKVVVLHAFQMLCPGCILHGVPQASSIHDLFADKEVQVIGLHSVFEHHNVMDKAALEAFVREFKLRFPIAIDQPSANHPIPQTMLKYQLEGTPSTIIIDKQGRIRLHHFGRLNDMLIGSLIGQLLAEPAATVNNAEPKKQPINTTKPATNTAAPQPCNELGCPT